MNATEWDDEAEAYLQMVCQQQSATGHKGGFPSAFPSTIFETSWVLDTLLESGFDKDDFLLADVRSLTKLLEKNLTQGKGTVGWGDIGAETAGLGEGGGADAGSLRGRSILHQIVKCANFLVKTWMRNNGPDKWHTSVQYPMMLIAQTFLLLLKRWAKNELDSTAVPKSLMYQEVPRTLLDILGRTMRSQRDDGSWESKREVTAYAVLTLAPLLSLPWVDFLKPEGIACMYRGKAYLENSRHQWRIAESVWIEKTVYGSPNLSQAYSLAALKVVVPTMFVSAKISDMFPPQLMKKMIKMSGFFAQVVPFSRAPQWKLQLSLFQSASYAATLKASRYDIFPPMQKASDEKYQEYIPFTWIGCRDYLSTPISSQTLWEMMLVSMFNFQVDAYMETAVWEQYGDKLPELKALIRTICSNKPEKRKRSDDDDSKVVSKKLANGTGTHTMNGTGRSTRNSVKRCHEHEHSNGEPVRGNGESVQANGVSGVSSNVEGVLTKFVNFALHHPKVLASPEPLRRWLAHELQTFLLAHITHMEDCKALSLSADLSTGSVTWSKPRTTFFNWVRTTSADHTSCPYSFVFFLCLIGEGGSALTMNLHQRYALEDACRHLAAMCRQYNDLGSIVRDQAEKNLNSVNFPEFDMGETDVAATMEELTDRKKRDLLAVAEYERRCLGRVIGELEPSLDAGVMEKLRLFIQVTDLYGQIYVVRDIGIRRVEGERERI
ncbi:hypothetical protein K458DRAFT_446746 [Lentithecium fluviatile CBS 122367]|uniref:Ent-kaurene synthase n=1 Tax=Lentithecium fluviatile CBS 122367 TaxID=1168545 RepID=A0A6G1IIG0_9PLEO|nr:hypothetical protein K458DRAFT_446746 [Lentithecium fluviatile CBS 122367]